MIQHVVRGNESLEAIASFYPGVSWQDIANATFGGHSVSAIYDWLSTHGGVPGRPYDGHHTGRHWMFAPGMVVNVPHPGPSVSPVQGTPDEKPGGSSVDVEPSGPSGPGRPPKQAATGGGLTTWLIIGAAVYFIFGDEIFGKKKKKRKTRRKTRRKPAKRRRRRR